MRRLSRLLLDQAVDARPVGEALERHGELRGPGVIPSSSLARWMREREAETEVPT